MVSGIRVAGRESLRDRLDRRIDSVSEEFGLEARDEIDRVEIEYIPGAIAQTRFNGAEIEVAFDREKFFEMPEVERDRTTLHELLHVKQFNRTLTDWLGERFGVREEARNKFRSASKNLGDIEAEVELILEQLFPEASGSSYPREKHRRKRELRQQDIDVTELFEEVEELEEKAREEDVDLNPEKAYSGHETGYLENFTGDLWDDMGEYLEKGSEMLENYFSSGDEYLGFSPDSCSSDLYGLTVSGNMMYEDLFSY